jgi:ATP-dependent RNA helicase RhlE
MLDLGFIVPLRRIVKLVPARRQTLFFSATMPRTIAEFAASLLTDPVRVAVAPVATTVESVTQNVIFVASAEKQAALERILADPSMQRVLVFTRTKHGADKVVRNLAKAGVEAAAIHGNKSQPQRERALAAFKAGRTRVLVATDIAARGIHVEGVTHVINFELPNVPESYVHRIGRTARAGAAGAAISLCNAEERAYLRDIEKLTRIAVPVAAAPAGIRSVAEESPAKRRNAPRHSQRQSRRHKQHAKLREPKQPRNGGRDRGKREHNPGLDPTAGLPAFLMRAPHRRESNDRNTARA